MNQPIPAHELHAVLTEAHYDLYKDVHGISPRWIDYDELTTPELEARMISLIAEAEEAAAVDAEEEARLAKEEAEADEAAAAHAEVAHQERWLDEAQALGYAY